MTNFLRRNLHKARKQEKAAKLFNGDMSDYDLGIAANYF